MATAKSKFAAAFIDQEDKRQPVFLAIRDPKFPVGKWIRKGCLLVPSNILDADVASREGGCLSSPPHLATLNRFSLREFAAREMSNALLAKTFGVLSDDCYFPFAPLGGVVKVSLST